MPPLSLVSRRINKTIFLVNQPCRMHNYSVLRKLLFLLPSPATCTHNHTRKKKGCGGSGLNHLHKPHHRPQSQRNNPGHKCRLRAQARLADSHRSQTVRRMMNGMEHNVPKYYSTPRVEQKNYDTFKLQTRRVRSLSTPDSSTRMFQRIVTISPLS